MNLVLEINLQFWIKSVKNWVEWYFEKKYSYSVSEGYFMYIRFFQKEN